eukprot:TRINITY_DN36674_c0_g1_i1.p1 TRINITY_DN36674_c0_g1~~TRINITY_DN36674_c0_g1_i1.p1  ORF type:complete len:211 (+),score=14.48 TRINITY_DN36674_c0_g1_i1:85-633(+)
MADLLNPTPEIFEKKSYTRDASSGPNADIDPDARDPLDALEVFELIRNIKDPEHPNTLEELAVVDLDGVTVTDNHHMTSASGSDTLTVVEPSRVQVVFTPTIPTCSMSTLIGLAIRVMLLRSLPPHYKVHVSVTPGSHDQEAQLNKQLNDKERVSAALENPTLVSVVDQCLYHAYGKAATAG